MLFLVNAFSFTCFQLQRCGLFFVNNCQPALDYYLPVFIISATGLVLDTIFRERKVILQGRVIVF